VTRSGYTPTVHITTAPYGLFAAGTIYRMDEVPLRAGGYLACEWPTDEAVLRRLKALLGDSPANRAATRN